MSRASAMLRRGCIAAATVAGVLHQTVAVAASVTSLCDASQYYDVVAGECKHCDEACFEHEKNGTIIRFLESTCLELCPGYVKDQPHPVYPPNPSDMVVRLTLMEGGLLGFLIALLIIGIIVVVILRKEVSAVLKRCYASVRMVKSLGSMFGDEEDPDPNETSYIKLSDPSDEVEFLDRETCV